MTGVFKKWLNKFGRSSHSADSNDSIDHVNESLNNNKPAPDPGDKRKKDADSQEDNKFTPLDKKQKLLDGRASKPTDNSTKSETSTPVSSMFMKKKNNNKSSNLTFQQKYQDSKFHNTTSPSVESGINKKCNPLQEHNNRPKLRRAKSTCMKSNQTILRSQATSNELQSWLDELESKRRDRNVSGGGAITPKNLPVSPRHVNMLKNTRPGSPYSRPGSNSHSPARISRLNNGSNSGNLTPTHENKNRRSSLAMRAKDYSSPSTGGKRDLRKQMIQLENLVPSLKEREAELKKISQEIKLAPGKNEMKSPKAGSGTPKAAPTTPKRSPRNDYKNIRSRSPRNSESMSRVSTSQVSQEAIKLSSKQNNMDVDNSVVEQSDSSDSECTDGEFEDDFGNFSIQAPYDITPAQSRRQTTQHTPRKLQIKVNKKKQDQTFLQQVVDKLEPSSIKQQPLPLSAPSFSATLMASSRNITPDRSTQVMKQSNSMKIPTIKPLVPPTTSSAESSNSLTAMFSKKQSSNTFTCDVCMVQVDKSAEQCASCETPNPSFKSTKQEPTKPSFSFGTKPLETKIDSTPVMDNTSLSALFKKSNAKKDTYTCSDCMCSNPITVENCPACEAVNPNFTGSSSKSAQKTASKPAPTFSFGQTTSTSLAPKASETVIPASSAPSLSSMFGQSSKSNKYTCDGCMCSNDLTVEICPACETANPKFKGNSSKPAEKPAPTFNFGATSSSSPAVKNLSAGEPAAKPAPTFSFGTTTSEPPKTTSLSSMFNSAASKSSKYTCDGCMCSNDVSMENCPACETPNPKFTGTSSKPAEKKPAPTFSFGAVAPVSKAPAAAAAPSFSFGGSPAVKPVEVAKAAPTFSFGAEKTEEPSAKRKQAEPAPVSGGFAFGKTASNESSPFKFGSTPTTETKTDSVSSTPFNFSAPTETSTQKPAPAFNFGSAAVEEPKKPETSNVFQFGQSTPSDQNKQSATTAAATSSGFNFGSTVKPAEPISTSASPFQFGQAEQQPAVSTTNSPFQFGKTNNDAQKSESLFGSKPTTTAAPASFQFGTQKSGDMSMLTPEAGSSTAAPAFNFGGAAPTTATNSNPFQFGQTNQTQQSAPSSNSTPFQFGASSTNQNTDNSTPFQFGGAPQTAPVTQNVNPFGAQSSGMGNMQQQQQAAPSFNFNSTAPQQNTGFNQAAAPEQTGGDNPFAFGQSNQAAAPGGGRKIAKATRRRKR